MAQTKAAKNPNKKSQKKRGLKKKPAPVGFGSVACRFTKISRHPKLDPTGIYVVRPLACDPCLYDPTDMSKVFQVNKNKISKDPWRFKSELEEWSQHLGYKNAFVLAERRWQASVLGPAWHEIRWPKKYEPACKNVGFGRTPRLMLDKSDTPGPGTYFRVPYKAPYGPHSSRPTFEREDPCRFTVRNINQLAPNIYKIIDPESIEMKPHKLVSLRGPYDLFTGERDDTTIRNHFGKSKVVSSSTWPLALKGYFDTYKNSHFGTMNKTGRAKPHRGRNAIDDPAFFPRNPDEPGPAHYQIEKERTLKENKHPFNSSYYKPRGYRRLETWPGVGRYSPKKIPCLAPNKGHRSVFISKTPRTIGAYIPAPMNNF